MFEFGQVYSYAKMYMAGALMAAIILAAIISVYTYCGNIGRERKISLLILYGIVLALHSSQFLALVSPPAEFVLFTKAYYICLGLLGPAFMYFCYVTVRKKFMSRRDLALLSIFPAITVLLVISNEYHHLIYSISNYICAITGLTLLLFYQRRKGILSFSRFGCYPVAILFILAVDIMEFFYPKLFLYDLTPVSIALAQGFLVFTQAPLSGYKSILTSRMNVLDHINEGIIMTDTGGSILYANESPFNEFLGVEPGKNIGRLFKNKSSHFQHGFTLPADEEASGELTLCFPQQRQYSYYIQPIKISGQHAAGMLYIFRDVSEYKSMINNLDAKNNELAIKLELLRRNTGIVRQLAEERERNRIMRHINSTVGQSITQIISNLESIGKKAEGGPEMKEHIQSSIEWARQGIKRLRESVSTLNRSLNPGGGITDDQGSNS